MKHEANNLFEALNDYEENGLDDWLVYRLDRDILTVYSFSRTII